MSTAAFIAALVLCSPGGFEVGLSAASPAVLQAGQALGPTASAVWTPGPWRLGVRGSLGLAVESDVSWRVRHTEVRVSALAGYAVRVGRGEIGLDLSAGGLALDELRTRHQADRFAMAGLDPEARGFTAGGLFSLELALRLFVYDRWRVSVGGGPSYFASDASRLGWTGALSVGWAFPESGP